MSRRTAMRRIQACRQGDRPEKPMRTDPTQDRGDGVGHDLGTRRRLTNTQPMKGARIVRTTADVRRSCRRRLSLQVRKTAWSARPSLGERREVRRRR